MKKGLFITIEKTSEALGGSTQTQRLAKALQTMGITHILQTREPGSTELGEMLREILLYYKGNVSKATELFLFMASRAQNYEENLKPALDKGYVVICDRYFDSTLSYQGAGRGWDTDTLYQLHQLATYGLFPDVTFVLHGVPHRSRSKEDRFERLGDTFYEKVKQCMLHIASTSDRHILLNANQPPEVITEQMVVALKERFPHIFFPASY